MGEQACGEVLRLTDCKSALMRELIAAKRRELEDVCAQAYMAAPPLPPLPAAGSGEDAAAVCSQARRVLAADTQAMCMQLLCPLAPARDGISSRCAPAG